MKTNKDKKTKQCDLNSVAKEGTNWIFQSLSHPPTHATDPLQKHIGALHNNIINRSLSHPIELCHLEWRRLAQDGLIGCR